MKFDSIILFFFASAGIIYFLLNVFQYAKERNKLRHLLFSMVIGNESDSKNQKEKLIGLMKYLQATISFHTIDRSKNRKYNLLRATAIQIAESKEGFCGENARLAINLMSMMDIQSARIYLTGKKWGHVLTECFVDGKWWFFDGHMDPKTAMNVDDICKLPSPQITMLRNDYKENPWIDFNRIKLFSKIPFLKSFGKIRLPFFMVLLFENPHLIKAVVGFFFFAFSVSVFLLIHS